MDSKYIIEYAEYCGCRQKHGRSWYCFGTPENAFKNCNIILRIYNIGHNIAVSTGIDNTTLFTFKKSKFFKFMKTARHSIKFRTDLKSFLGMSPKLKGENMTRLTWKKTTTGFTNNKAIEAAGQTLTVVIDNAFGVTIRNDANELLYEGSFSTLASAKKSAKSELAILGVTFGSEARSRVLAAA